jgi:PPOX class probable F420-dependent enzyme
MTTDLTLEAAMDWAAQRSHGVLITIRRDGRPQSSDISYRVADGAFEISVTDGRAKTANLRRDPRAVLHVTEISAWSYASFDGTVTLTEPARSTDDATADALVDYYRAVAGRDHPDWDEYRRAMVDEGRLLVRFAPGSVAGQVRG